MQAASSRQNQIKKSFFNEVFDSVIVTTSIGNYFTFWFGVIAYYSIANQIANELGCESFSDAIFRDNGCGELLKIGILDSGAAWAEGGIFATMMVFSSAIGILIGSANWLKQKSSQNNAMINAQMRGDAEVQSALSEVLLQDQDHDLILEVLSSRGHKQDWIKKIKTISGNAWYFSRCMLAFGLMLGLPKMVNVGTTILEDFGCKEDFIKLTLFRAGNEKQCSLISIYYAMTAFAYPWTLATWLGYASWEIAVTLQLLPEKVKKILFYPLGMLLHYLRWLMDPLMVYFCRDFFLDLTQHLLLWLKISIILTFFFGLYFILKDGLNFSNAILSEYNCPNFFSTFFSSGFLYDSLTCTTLTQILGIDAFPMKTEVFDVYPLIAATFLIGTLLGVSIGTCLIKSTPNLVILREKVESYHVMINRSLEFGKYASLLFLFPAAYAFFVIAIPKANDLLDRDGCTHSRYPIFIYKLYDDQCSALSRYRATAAVVSTMWIAFSYSALLAGVAGMSIHLMVKGGAKAVSLVCSQRNLFRTSFRRAIEIDLPSSQRILTIPPQINL